MVWRLPHEFDNQGTDPRRSRCSSGAITRSAGLDREEYAGAILSQELNARQTLDEVLAAFREEVSASGISDAELDELFRTARDEAGAQENV